ncbi:MAG: helix-turn-helix transcriptional regulator [Polyangiales bacterium]
MERNRVKAKKRPTAAIAPSALPGIEGIANPEALRDAALSLDDARSARGECDNDRALLVWEGLVRGRVSLVDWFDSGGRRFVLVKLNSLKGSCSCGLTAREFQVAMSATLGESSKLTGYRLGISPSRVSALLKASMRKLGVRTKAQLVMMVRVLGNQSKESLESACQP